MNLLLVEDDAVLADGLSHTLASSGYQLHWASTVAGAERLLIGQDMDLALLDLGLPDGDGLDLLLRIRQRKLSLPVIILTARDGIDQRIAGIEQGADDYLTKPFALRELEARIHALIRRCYSGFGHSLTLGALCLDTQQHQLKGNGRVLPLSSREYGVLEILFLKAGQVVAKERIAQRLDNSGEGLSDNAIEIHVHRLRKRLEAFGVVIRTVRGLGYLLEQPEHG